MLLPSTVCSDGPSEVGRANSNARKALPIGSAKSLRGWVLQRYKLLAYRDLAPGEFSPADRQLRRV